MPYVQSERAILYSLHRGACSRGLQAGRERELVPSLCAKRCGLFEMLISGSGEACALQRVEHVSVYLVYPLSVCASARV
jgi:hypothetical protein